jgi:hypothetical protein
VDPKNTYPGTPRVFRGIGVIMISDVLSETVNSPEPCSTLTLEVDEEDGVWKVILRFSYPDYTAAMQASKQMARQISKAVTREASLDLLKPHDPAN